MLLHELYQDMILDHGKTPRNQGILPTATHQHHGHNPLCGDQLTLYVIAHDHVVHEVRFEGSGCAISMASASLLTEAVKGKTFAEIDALFQPFHELVTEGKTPSVDLGKLMAFRGVAKFPIRVKCATLAWHTLKAALRHEINPVSTE